MQTPREVEQPCPKCGHGHPVLNGAHYRKLRADAGLTLSYMAGACGVTIPYLSFMESGSRPFAAKYAEIYERVIGRHVRAGLTTS